jgi:hypothetical protein
MKKVMDTVTEKWIFSIVKDSILTIGVMKEIHVALAEYLSHKVF